MRHPRLSASLFGLSLLACSARAQTLGAQRAPSDQTVPRELLAAVLGLFGRYGGGSPEPGIQVGSVSPEVRARIPEIPGTRVIGSVTLMPFGNIVVLDAPISSDSLRHSVERSLQAKGFERSRQGPNQGFVSASRQLPAMWCFGGTFLLVSIESRDKSTSVADIVVGGEALMGGCERRLTGSSAMSDLPTLYDPEGASSNNQKCFMEIGSGSLGPATMNAIVMQWAPAKLLDHYGKQLQDSGWARADSGEAAASRVLRTWIRRPAGGDVEYLTLSVTVPAAHSECRIIDMNVQRRQTR